MVCGDVKCTPYGLCGRKATFQEEATFGVFGTNKLQSVGEGQSSGDV